MTLDCVYNHLIEVNLTSYLIYIYVHHQCLHCQESMFLLEPRAPTEIAFSFSSFSEFSACWICVGVRF